jgi:2,3,4,5-tetrahydropyridine-2-carboxylate N-succinyltransferase
MSGTAEKLAADIRSLYNVPSHAELPGSAEAAVAELLELLERGGVRAAERDGSGVWHAVPWVKQGILVAFRVGRIVEQPGAGSFHFQDKHNLPTRRFDVTDRVRIVPGGSAVRRGAYVAPGVVCMPPMYINVGAWVGEGSMIDSHSLVGSCAQVGAGVHLSAAAQLGGVLEPINMAPVVIEDDVIVGGNCGVYEGPIVREGAVLAAGVVLTRGTPVFDLVGETVYKATRESPLEIPARAVVVPGSRTLSADRSRWGAEHGLSLQTPVIVKYRDAKTDVATALEDWLR